MQSHFVKLEPPYQIIHYGGVVGIQIGTLIECSGDWFLSYECPYPEGELKWAGRTIYSVSKKQKDTVVVNGRKHLFNHIEKIQEIKFD